MCVCVCVCVGVYVYVCIDVCACVHTEVRPPTCTRLLTKERVRGSTHNVQLEYMCFKYLKCIAHPSNICNIHNIVLRNTCISRSIIARSRVELEYYTYPTYLKGGQYTLYACCIYIQYMCCAYFVYIYDAYIVKD